MSQVNLCLERSIRVGWCLPWFLPVWIGVSSRLMPTNIYASRLVPTKNYRNKFCSYLPKGLPHKYGVQCLITNKSHMSLFSYVS